ncbi:type IV pilus assembly protein PilM [Candidatus Parcubacteria bacterium]|nr:type IV pilus assembly protein PilM [Candidatus Parcubacteria bacterium]
MLKFNNNLNAFGIDFSDRSIKVAQIKKSGDKLQIYAYGRKDIPKGLIVDGEIKEKEEIVRLIKKTLLNSKINSIKSKFVIYSIPEPKGFIRVMEIKRVEEQDVEDAVKYEAQQLFPINVEESYVDWQILPDENNKKETMKVLAAAVPQELVDSYSSVLKDAGLKPVAAEIESIAITRSLINKNQSSRPILVIDLGRDRTSFIIFKNPAVQFTASIPVCGEEIIKAVSEKMNISEGKSEEIIKECGLIFKDDCKDIYRAIQPSLYEMIRYISKLINFYKEHYKSESDIAKVVICGGEAKMPGMSSFLSLRVKKEVEKGNPWINIISSDKKEIPPIPRNDSMVFVTVLGLALRGAKNF